MTYYSGDRTREIVAEEFLRSEDEEVRAYFEQQKRQDEEDRALMNEVRRARGEPLDDGQEGSA